MTRQTDYIDLFYQHRVDPAMSIEDVAGALKGTLKNYLYDKGILNIKDLMRLGTNDIELEQTLLRAFSSVKKTVGRWIVRAGKIPTSTNLWLLSGANVF